MRPGKRLGDSGGAGLHPRYSQLATEAFAGDPRALDVLTRLAEHWTGDGDQLIAVVSQLLPTVRRR